MTTHTFRILVFLLVFAIAEPAPLHAHTQTESGDVHTHADGSEHAHDHYTSDPDQPIHSKLAECAAIYNSAVENGTQVNEFLSDPHKEQLSGNAQKLRDKATIIARKKDQDEPEQFIADTYNEVSEIWSKRWYYAENEIHYSLIAENQAWLNYCKELGVSLNIFPLFPNESE